MKYHQKIAVVALWLMSCSGNHSSRTTNASADSNDNFTPSSSDDANAPEVVSGAYLVEVQPRCVVNVAHPCSQVRFSATIKAGTSDPIAFSSSALTSLGISSSLWSIGSLPGVTCQSSEGEFAFSPVCSRADLNTLAQTVFKASLSIVLKTGQAFAGDAPEAFPLPPAASDVLSGADTGPVFGKFMHVDARAGFGPSNVRYTNAKNGFSEIWKYLPKSLYVTNILYVYTPGSPLTYQVAQRICTSLDSGDGPRKWRLPTFEELCGRYSISSIACEGGMAMDEIRLTTITGGAWDGFFWSSTLETDGLYRVSNLEKKTRDLAEPNSNTPSVLCVRQR